MAAAKKSALSNDDIMVEISVTLGTADLRVNQLRSWDADAVVELDRDINDNVDIYANDVLYGHGESRHHRKRNYRHQRNRHKFQISNRNNEL